MASRKPTAARPLVLVAEQVREVLRDGRVEIVRAMEPQPKPFVQTSPDRHALRHEAPYLDSYCSEPKTPENPRGMSDVWCWWCRDDRQGAETRSGSQAIGCGSARRGARSSILRPASTTTAGLGR